MQFFCAAVEPLMVFGVYLTRPTNQCCKAISNTEFFSFVFFVLHLSAATGQQKTSQKCI